MKIHKLSGRAHNRGCYSKYYILSPKVGLKVIVTYPGDPGADSQFEHNEARILLTSNLWRAAKEEFKLLEQAYVRCKLFPKPHAVCAVKLGKYLYPAIRMEHISGATLYKTKGISSSQREDIIDDLETYLADLGIEHGDLHEDNIIVAAQKNEKIKLRPIDCTPDYIIMERKTKKRLKLWV